MTKRRQLPLSMVYKYALPPVKALAAFKKKIGSFSFEKSSWYVYSKFTEFRWWVYAEGGFST